MVSIVLLALGVGSALLPESIVAQLALDRDAVAAHEFWRLWTGNLVHFSVRHALVDLGALFVLSLFVEVERGARSYASLLFCVAPLLSLALLMAVPALAEYRGASGLCVTLAVALGLSLWRTRPAWRGALAVPACGLAFKTALEAGAKAPNVSGLSDDIAVVWQAHIFGAVLGALGFAWQYMPALWPAQMKKL